MRPDTIAEAVLAREDVARFLEGGHGLSSDAAPIANSLAWLWNARRDPHVRAAGRGIDTAGGSAPVNAVG